MVREFRHKQLSLWRLGMAGWGWRTDLLNNCVCFHGVVIDSLLTANLGTLFVKRRTGFLTYADDPKVSVIIRDGAVNL